MNKRPLVLVFYIMKQSKIKHILPCFLTSLGLVCHLENPDVCTTGLAAVIGNYNQEGALLCVKTVKHVYILYKLQHPTSSPNSPNSKMRSQNSIQKFPSVIYSTYSSRLLNTCTVPLLR